MQACVQYGCTSCLISDLPSLAPADPLLQRLCALHTHPEPCSRSQPTCTVMGLRVSLLYLLCWRALRVFSGRNGPWFCKNMQLWRQSMKEDHVWYSCCSGHHQGFGSVHADTLCQGVDADMLTPRVLFSRYVQRARAMEHSTTGPGSMTLTCSQSGQAAGGSGQPDGLPQIMVRIINPSSLEPRSRTQCLLQARASQTGGHCPPTCLCRSRRSDAQPSGCRTGLPGNLRGGSVMQASRQQSARCRSRGRRLTWQVALAAPACCGAVFPRSSWCMAASLGRPSRTASALGESTSLSATACITLLCCTQQSSCQSLTSHVTLLLYAGLD